MVGLVQGTPSSLQPLVNPQTGLITQPWLTFFSGLTDNASQTTLPSGLILPAGSVDLSAFSQYLTPIGLVTSLPSPTGYTGPSVVFVGDTGPPDQAGNLYRLVGGQWTLAVPSSAIIGQLDIGAIPQIPTTQLTGYLQANQIQANSIGADQISTAYLYAGDIAASQIQAGSLSAGVILTSSITASQVNTTTLSAITANLGTITAGTLTGTTIQTASSGTRLALTPGSFLQGYDGSTLTILLTPNLSAGAGLELFDNGGFGFFSSGPLFPVYAAADGGTTAIKAVGSGSGSDAIQCSVGGITINNGYINLTGTATATSFSGSGASLTGLTQSQISGLTTSSSPTFNGLTINGNIAIGGNNITDGSSNDLLGSSGGQAFLGNSSHAAYCNNSFLANPDNTYNLGGSATTNRWKTVFATVGTINTSDERYKDNIQDETLGLAWINAQRPVSFDTNDGNPGPFHGLLAQHVEKTLNGVGFAGLHRPEGENGRYGLNYSEFIGPIIKGMQEMSAEVLSLRAELAALRADVLLLRGHHG